MHTKLISNSLCAQTNNIRWGIDQFRKIQDRIKYSTSSINNNRRTMEKNLGKTDYKCHVRIIQFQKNHKKELRYTQGESDWKCKIQN